MYTYLSPTLHCGWHNPLVNLIYTDMESSATFKYAVVAVHVQLNAPSLSFGWLISSWYIIHNCLTHYTSWGSMQSNDSLILVVAVVLIFKGSLYSTFGVPKGSTEMVVLHHKLKVLMQMQPRALPAHRELYHKSTGRLKKAAHLQSYLAFSLLPSCRPVCEFGS